MLFAARERVTGRATRREPAVPRAGVGAGGIVGGRARCATGRSAPGSVCRASRCTSRRSGEALGRQLLYGAFAFFLLIPAVFGPQDRGLIRRVLRSRPAVASGVVSYGIYLWHETWMLKILDWLHRPLFTTSFLKLTLRVTVLAVGSAALSYVLVEQPFQRLGRRRPAPPAPTGPPVAELVEAAD